MTLEMLRAQIRLRVNTHDCDPDPDGEGNCGVCGLPMNEEPENPELDCA
jgi:hypothetical protein